MSIYTLDHLITPPEEPEALGLMLTERSIYGSSRIGTENPNELLARTDETLSPTIDWVQTVGDRHYELSNHLGNVLQVVTDRKLAIETSPGSGIVDYYVADVVSQSDYYPFGMMMPGRNDNTPEYRYGFNGMEKDDEVTEQSGTSYDFGARFYNSRVGRWLSVDPHSEKYPAQSPYTFSLNSPILYDDPDGRDAKITITKEQNASTGEIQTVITVSSKIYLTGKTLTPEERASIAAYKDKIFSQDYTSEDGTTILRFDVEYIEAAAPSDNLPKPVNNLLTNGSNNSLSEIPLQAADQSNSNSPNKLTEGDNYAVFNSSTTGQSVAYPKASKLSIDKYNDPDNFGYAVIHETMHLFGLSDQYYLDKDGVLKPYDFVVQRDIMSLYVPDGADPYGFYDDAPILSQRNVENMINGINEEVENGLINVIDDGDGINQSTFVYGLYDYLNTYNPATGEGHKLDDGDAQLQNDKNNKGTPAGPAP